MAGGSSGQTGAPDGVAAMEKPTIGAGEAVAWVAVAWVDADGRKAAPERAAAALLAVCVHAAFSTDIAERCELVRRVATTVLAAHPRLRDVPSLWTFPAGYFGFDAWVFGFLKRHKLDLGPSWPSLSTSDLAQIRACLRDDIRILPGGATVVLGVDHAGSVEDQYAWILRNDGEMVIPAVRRSMTGIPARKFGVGQLSCAAFVCGEGAGSRRWVNGPFDADEYLTEPGEQLANTDVLVIPAHGYVNGEWESPVGSNRRPLQRGLERFSAAGAAVLAHHHEGNAHRVTEQSDWILYRRGGANYVWVSDSDLLRVIW